MTSASLSRGEICAKIYRKNRKKRKKKKEKKKWGLNGIPMTPLTTLRTAQLFQMSWPRISSTEGSLMGSIWGFSSCVEFKEAFSIPLAESSAIGKAQIRDMLELCNEERIVITKHKYSKYLSIQIQQSQLSSIKTKINESNWDKRIHNVIMNHMRGKAKQREIENVVGTSNTWRQVEKQISSKTLLTDDKVS